MVKCKICKVRQTEEQRGKGSFDVRTHFGRLVPRGATLEPDSAWDELILCPTCNQELTSLMSKSFIGFFITVKLLTTFDAAPPG
jgi:hypothetical protein